MSMAIRNISSRKIVNPIDNGIIRNQFPESCHLLISGVIDNATPINANPNTIPLENALSNG